MNELTFPLAVVANDAGAANLILGWVRPHIENQDIRFVLAGPALSIFTRDIPDFSTTNLEHALNGAKLLISGTSSATAELEHTARVLAVRSKIPTIGVLDHWVNYTQRFIRGGVTVMPDSLWVSDEFAYKIAKETFPNTNVYIKENQFLNFVLEQASNTKPETQITGTKILYILEPFSTSWGNSGVLPEFQALDFFEEKIFGSSGILAPVEVLLRIHPSEISSKYFDWLKKPHKFAINLDQDRSLGAAIAWADCVVGCESYALFVAFKAGKRVISCMPPCAPECRLPMKIEHLREI